MALVVLCVAPFSMFTVFGSAYSIQNALRGENKAYSSAGAIADEVLAGIRTVASFNAQPFEIGRYEKRLIEGRRLGVRKALIIALFAALHIFIFFISMAIVFWYVFKKPCFILKIKF